MSVNMSASIRRQLINTECCFRKSCEQVFVLNRQVQETTRRFNKAEQKNNKVLRYSLRLRLSVLEGVRNMYYELAAKKAADIVELQRRVLDIDVNSADDSDSDNSELTYDAIYSSEAADVQDDEDGLELC